MTSGLNFMSMSLSVIYLHLCLPIAQNSVCLQKSRRVDVFWLSGKAQMQDYGIEIWIYPYDSETTEQSSEYRANDEVRQKRAL